MSSSIVLRVIVGFLLAGLGLWVDAKPDTKLTPTEIVNKHLESIGTPDARAHVKGTRVNGDCVITIREGGSGRAEGVATLASQGDLNLLKIVFQSEESATWLMYDGNKTSVSQFKAGQRTPLESFFAAYQGIVKEGLVGGTLSESWPLLNLEKKKPKLESLGAKDIGGKKLLALKYSPRKGSDLKITLFFDPETFTHLRTEYAQTIYPSDQQRIQDLRGSLPSGNSPQRSSNTKIQAVEQFSDFKEEQGLHLPHTYEFQLSIQSEVTPALIDWKMNLSDFTFDSPFEPDELTRGKG